MAVGRNDSWYRVVLLRGVLNLSLLSVCLLSNSDVSGMCQWVCFVSPNHSSGSGDSSGGRATA